MDMKVYVSCYIPSIKQTVMRIVYIDSDSTVLEARDQILQALGLGEKRVLISLGLEREEYLFSGTQVLHFCPLKWKTQHKPCKTMSFNTEDWGK